VLAAPTAIRTPNNWKYSGSYKSHSVLKGFEDKVEHAEQLRRS
jgi:hypothetical protein